MALQSEDPSRNGAPTNKAEGLRSRSPGSYWAGLLSFALALIVGCDRDADSSIYSEASTSIISEREARANRAATSRRSDPRPSVVLIVVDTLRADAVSAQGRVAGTTPVMDALARRGIRYALAFAPAPFTSSSHASLFTGLRVDQHGVGLSSDTTAPTSLQMLAEDFRAAGYETAGFSENSLLGSEFGFEQGFDDFEVADILEVVKADRRGEDPAQVLGLLRRIQNFDRNRDRSRPYFLFVNIIDAHDPYMIREDNPWIPENLEDWELRAVKSRYLIPRSLCGRVPPPVDQAILRGLYLGDVHAADAKLGRILAVLDSTSTGSSEPGGSEPRLTIVTSDHGEHLGEHNLMGHRFSVRNTALRIPLIVAGLPDMAPAVVESPVELRSVRQSLLCWALEEACPADLPLETVPDAETDGPPIFSIYSDAAATTPKVHREKLGFGDGQWIPDFSRSACKPKDRVFGLMASMVRYPLKVSWVEDQGMVLHDLSWDPGERSDQMRVQPELAEKLAGELETFVEANLIGRKHAPEAELSEDTIRALKSLGYLE